MFIQVYSHKKNKQFGVRSSNYLKMSDFQHNFHLPVNQVKKLYSVLN
ncbi:hypothetical protein HMPREF9418_0132 [Neisseria macacae ATCC 33926]|uniref:Uncharacterized protein n=1 Tax=Neisseria macacae ATCC 33926 TaxID=997348 RepID=A0AA36XM59_9NEIS|nr:hypothetical protein HMPREF9418_0132 [Neisseria macacae ATCC 33926]